jgi:ADP-L-glycero-D-manno-heptose 6-epimerase
VDELAEGAKFVNLREAQLADYFDSEEFYEAFDRGELGRFDLVFHQGACSDTMQHDGRYMMRTNFRCSKNLLDACFKQGTRLIYARLAPCTEEEPTSLRCRETNAR